MDRLVGYVFSFSVRLLREVQTHYSTYKSVAEKNACTNTLKTANTRKLFFFFPSSGVSQYNSNVIKLLPVEYYLEFLKQGGLFKNHAAADLLLENGRLLCRQCVCVQNKQHTLSLPEDSLS